MAWLLGILISLLVAIATLWVTILIIVGNDGTGTDFLGGPFLIFFVTFILYYLGIHKTEKKKRTNAKELSNGEE